MIIKTTKAGRIRNADRYQGVPYLSIRRTRGTFTQEAVDLLEVDVNSYICFEKIGDELFVKGSFAHLPNYKRVSKVNGRYGINTGFLLKAGIKSGGYKISEHGIIDGTFYWKLEKI